MANKELDGWEKVINRVFAATQPYKQAAVERFTRSYIAPFVRDAGLFKRLQEMVGNETLLTFGSAVPGAINALLNELPDSMFLTREIGDSIKLLITTFFTEMSRGLRGDTNPTAEKMSEVEAAAIKAVESVLDQDVYYDRAGFFHFAACPNWQGGNAKNQPKAALRAALELGRKSGTCCRQHSETTVAKAAEGTAQAAPKAAPAPVYIEFGASVMDVVGAMLQSERTEDRAVAQRILMWLQELAEKSQKDFLQANQLLNETFDTVDEAYALDAVKDELKLGFLNSMRSRKEEKKSQLAAAWAKMEANVEKTYAFVKKALHGLDASLVSDAALAQQRERIATLQEARVARRARNKPRFGNLWGLL